MGYFFTSDTHFGHTNIIKYCNRPFKSIEHMNEVLIKKWNNKVKLTDTVFHLGDFSFKGFTEFKQKLNGNIILIQGNHDEDNRSIIKQMIINLNNKNWVLTHIPFEQNIPDLCLCGHVHDCWKYKKYGNKIMINVGVDVWDFEPISMKQILDFIKSEIK
jgi:calcineurin-like phosphoesterase family protein